MTLGDLEKWRLLLAQTEVIYREQQQLHWTQSPTQLLEYQNQTGVILPSEYKGFCQIFGMGMFTKNWFEILCPSPEDNGRGPASSEDAIQAIKDSYPYPEDICSLLDSSYMFGTGDGFIFFFWDLRSYDTVDQSYDIYVLDDERSYSLYYLGRSFFEFIRDVCLRDRVILEFPSLINPLGNPDGSHPTYGRRAFRP
jgi:hypothetical protein